jgi:phage baseplate assembly protein W
MAKNSIPPPLIGWPLLPVPDATGSMNYPGLEESVRQSIQVILTTRAGEQLMRPQFGGGLQELLFEPNNITTYRSLHDRVSTALAQWEQRIAVDRVEVNEVAGEPTQIRIEIHYRLLRTGEFQQTGLTVQLEQ